MTIRRRTLLCLLAAATAGCSFGGSRARQEPGELEVRVPESRSLILDVVGEDPHTIVPIEIRNACAKPLTLSLVSKSCTCVEMGLPTEAIPAGASRKVDVSMGAAPGNRRIAFTIEGRTDSGTVVQKAAELKLSVFSRQEALPRAIIRALTAADLEPIVLTLCLHTSDPKPNPRDHKIRVSKLPDFLVAEPAKSLGIRRVAADVQAMEWEVKLRRREDTNGGPKSSQHGQIAIAFDALSPCLIPYHFTCLEELTVSPDVIYFDATAVGQHADRYAIVQIGGKEAVSIPEVKSSRPDFSLESLESLPSAVPGDARRFQIKLRFAPRRAGLCRSEITVLLNVPQRREARIVATGRGV